MKKFSPEMITAIVDTREQRPANLGDLKIIRQGLTTGDYSILGLTSEISLERKNMDDMVACCGRERERFQRELDRIRAYPVRAVIIEATWEQLCKGGWRSQISPEQVTGSILKWMCDGVPFVFAGNDSGTIIRRMLLLSARHYYNKLSNFNKEIMSDK
jgi:DNA excision repair protein ERCC-4